MLNILGEKDYGKKLKEDRHKGFDPRPEHLRKVTTKNEIDTFLLRCKEKNLVDKSGNKVHSNWKCLYDRGKYIYSKMETIPGQLFENWELFPGKFFRTYPRDPPKMT